MKKSIAVWAGVLGIVAGAESMENNASLAPLTYSFNLFLTLFNYSLTTIVLAQAAAPAAPLQPDYLLTTCKQTESTGDSTSAFHAVDPAGLLKIYMQNKYDRPVDFSAIKNVTLLEGTTVGKITSVIDNTGRSWYHYDPIPNYTGNDRAVFLAEYEGKVYKIVINIVVSPTVGESPLMSEETPVCPPPKLIKVNGKPVSGSSGDDLNTLTSASAGQASTSLSTGITVTVADLPGGAVGQTVGEGINATITLDDNAANYNWFIDPTPADNSEYLPTSNPYEWVAKAGSAAYGKMDMLSVLLHEYGHALGIEHSADNHDYMATTLTPGVRRLPSADEMALMQNLIAQAKGDTPSLSRGGLGWGWGDSSAQQVGMNSDLPGNAPAPMPLPIPLGAGFGVAFLGRLRSSRYGGINIEGVLPYAPTTQYAVAANATLTNGSLNAADGWTTNGSVDICNGVATLNEISTSQTRLSQVFMLGENDRYLSFTLAGTALDNPHPLPNPPLEGAGANGAAPVNGYGGSGSSPSDAFEVALLDANTGFSVLGSDGLTRTDAFLNLQGDGTQHTSDWTSGLASPCFWSNNAAPPVGFRRAINIGCGGQAVLLESRPQIFSKRQFVHDNSTC
jgi:hypothetical protein